MTRRICVVTGSRAEYGLLRGVMEGIRKSTELELQLAVTGSHLVEAFGATANEIESDGFRIDEKVDIELASDTPAGIARSMGLGLIGFGAAFERLRPEIVVVLGDRFEIFSAASAALVANIPVAHVHGGERTEGAMDEAFRHAITKMSQLHFVATEEYRRRVIQLGESPERVFLVGGLGVDAVQRTSLLSREELEKQLGFSLGVKSLLVTFHPATLERGSAKAQMTELLAALDTLEDTTLIFSLPNADPEGGLLRSLIEDYTKTHDNAKAFPSLGQRRYLSCMQHVDGVVGNSSSGLLEAPSFHKGSVNIGDRQAGRVRAESVIDCKPDRRAILKAIETLYSAAFQAKLKDVSNPYGSGGASEKIVVVLKEVGLSNLTRKTFYDLPPECFA